VDASSPPAPTPAELITTGVVDLDRHASDMTAETAKASSPAPIPSGMTCVEGASHTITIGADEWTNQLDCSAPEAPGLTRWIHRRYPSSSAGQRGLTGIDPVTLFNRLRSDGRLHLVGHETIDGVDTIHYQWTPSKPLPPIA